MSETIPHSQEELPLVNPSKIGIHSPITAITRQGMVPHAPTTNNTNHGSHIPSFQFPPPRPADGPLLPPPRNEEYVLQYVNYPAHGYLDVSGPYTTNMHTFAEENVKRDVNPQRNKYGNCESRGSKSDKRKQIQEQIAAYEAGLAKFRAKLAPEPRTKKYLLEPGH